MTLSDFVSRITAIYNEKSVCFRMKPDAQVKLGKAINDSENTFDYFDIQRVGNDIVLVPSDKWDSYNKSR